MGETLKKLELEAKTDNLDQVLEFVDSTLEEVECSIKTQTQIDIAVEEIFVNIAHYAYNNVIGNATILVEMNTDPLTISITFIDNGTPYDPLAKADPDVTLSAEEREIGGLGIFMVKKTMDDIKYEYKDGKNILTLRKEI